MKARISLVALVFGLASCTTVGPNYAAPEADMADSWLETADPGAIDPVWWNKFDDPRLAELIEQALRNSPSLAEARARLTEARANRDIVRGGQGPQLSVAGSVTENQLSEDGQIPAGDIPGFEPGFSLFDLGFDSSWEIDFWGRNTRDREAAEARIEAAEARLHDTLVLITGEIARNYMDLREAQAALAVGQARVRAFDELTRLTQLRYDSGESSLIDLQRARSDANSARSVLPNLRAPVSGAAYRIAALVGEPPEALVPQLREAAPIPNSPDNILVGVRSDLLRRRPDIRAAERDLAAATADVGSATADIFPRFSLIGSVGVQSRSVDGLADGDNVRFTVGPSFSWPLFSGGRVRAQIRAADARAQASAARYEQTVLDALADSEGAINRFLEAQRAQTEALRAEEAEKASFALSKRRAETGEDDRLALQNARLALLSTQEAARTAEAETARAAASVFKALGGAWQAELVPLEPSPDS
ncbi:MAG: efflux transporter outer membrane subunit [Erythrobacter sp.]|uniref:efflux transporter outer membrane subunit n=1 Tax=Erythrobacter sp. TaxID=1042 RepID=UPI00260A89FB|nr:efflux transporter outer membrane subunit [Erythrobacter sp.]MDJ0979693.1 efflux transporter outer membrane subunit [Erythrobacter sp.]